MVNISVCVALVTLITVALVLQYSYINVSAVMGV